MYVRNMITSTNRNVFWIDGPIRGVNLSMEESSHKGPAMGSFDVFFHVKLNKLWTTDYSCQWFEIS